jgi:hypothetical protein
MADSASGGTRGTRWCRGGIPSAAPGSRTCGPSVAPGSRMYGRMLYARCTSSSRRAGRAVSTGSAPRKCSFRSWVKPPATGQRCGRRSSGTGPRLARFAHGPTVPISSLHSATDATGSWTGPRAVPRIGRHGNSSLEAGWFDVPFTIAGVGLLKPAQVLRASAPGARCAGHAPSFGVMRSEGNRSILRVLMDDSDGTRGPGEAGPGGPFS